MLIIIMLSDIIFMNSYLKLAINKYFKIYIVIS